MTKTMKKAALASASIVAMLSATAPAHAGQSIIGEIIDWFTATRVGDNGVTYQRADIAEQVSGIYGKYVPGRGWVVGEAPKVVDRNYDTIKGGIQTGTKVWIQTVATPVIGKQGAGVLGATVAASAVAFGEGLADADMGKKVDPLINATKAGANAALGEVVGVLPYGGSKVAQTAAKGVAKALVTAGSTAVQNLDKDKGSAKDPKKVLRDGLVSAAVDVALVVTKTPDNLKDAAKAALTGAAKDGFRNDEKAAASASKGPVTVALAPVGPSGAGPDGAGPVGVGPSGAGPVPVGAGPVPVGAGPVGAGPGAGPVGGAGSGRAGPVGVSPVGASPVGVRPVGAGPVGVGRGGVVPVGAVPRGVVLGGVVLGGVVAGGGVPGGGVPGGGVPGGVFQAGVFQAEVFQAEVSQAEVSPGRGVDPGGFDTTTTTSSNDTTTSTTGGGSDTTTASNDNGNGNGNGDGNGNGNGNGGVAVVTVTNDTTGVVELNEVRDIDGNVVAGGSNYTGPDQNGGDGPQSAILAQNRIHVPGEGLFGNDDTGGPGRQSGNGGRGPGNPGDPYSTEYGSSVGGKSGGSKGVILGSYSGISDTPHTGDGQDPTGVAGSDSAPVAKGFSNGGVRNAVSPGSSPNEIDGWSAGGHINTFGAPTAIVASIAAPAPTLNAGLNLESSTLGTMTALGTSSASAPSARGIGSAGIASAGIASAGIVSPGIVSPGIVSPGIGSAGIASAGIGSAATGARGAILAH